MQTFNRWVRTPKTRPVHLQDGSVTISFSIDVSNEQQQHHHHHQHITQWREIISFVFFFQKGPFLRRLNIQVVEARLGQQVKIATKEVKIHSLERRCEARQMSDSSHLPRTDLQESNFLTFFGGIGFPFLSVRRTLQLMTNKVQTNRPIFRWLKRTVNEILLVSLLGVLLASLRSFSYHGLAHYDSSEMSLFRRS